MVLVLTMGVSLCNTLAPPWREEGLPLETPRIDILIRIAGPLEPKVLIDSRLRCPNLVTRSCYNRSISQLIISSAGAWMVPSD